MLIIKIFKTLNPLEQTQHPSKIILDRFTSTLQANVLIKILSSLFGTNRSPMIIIDSEKYNER